MENLVIMLNELKRTYSGKTIFLTGHTGFKGSWLLKVLSLLGVNITGYALTPDAEPNIFSVIKGDNLCNSVIGDLRDKQKLSDAVLACNPDFIFHLAAQPLVRLSYAMPSETFEINAIGTANLLDAVRLLKKPCQVVCITTDKVYHNNEWEYPYRENDRLGGYDPYSASKACTELVIDSYRNSFFNINNYKNHYKAIAVGRAGNVIGGGDWSKDRLIPDIVKALSKDEPVEIRNPNSIRPWQHVLEPLFGYLLLGTKLIENPKAFSQAYNFGPYVTDALSVSEMVTLAINCWGKGKYFSVENSIQPHEAGLLKLDISKVRSELNWVPKFNAKSAVEYTINWYKEFYNHGNIIDFMDNQVQQFING
jgi:CDP-glucose 4,6-dehydratase